MGDRLLAPAALLAAATIAAAACGSSSGGGGPSPIDASAGGDGAFEAGDADLSLDAIFSCAPADVSQFTAPPYKPANAVPGACTQTQVDNFYAACLGATATNDLCSAFTSGNPACFSCLLSASGDPRWGPVVDNGRFLSMNGDGCMELLDPTYGLDCAKADQAAIACEDQACAANCPIVRDDPPSRRQAELAAYDACTQQADKAGCRAFAGDASTCVATESDGGAAARCFGGKTFQDLYAAIAPVFCVGAGGGG